MKASRGLRKWEIFHGNTPKILYNYNSTIPSTRYTTRPSRRCNYALHENYSSRVIHILLCATFPSSVFSDQPDYKYPLNTFIINSPSLYCVFTLFIRFLAHSSPLFHLLRELTYIRIYLRPISVLFCISIQCLCPIYSLFVWYRLVCPLVHLMSRNNKIKY